MNDFVKGQGPAFLAHILGRLSDKFVRGFEAWYPEAGIRTPARTRSTLRALSERGTLSVTELAGMLNQSHPLVITWLNQLKALGIVQFASDPDDGRRTLASLTAKGRAEARKSELSARVGETAYRKLLQEADATDLFDALWRVEEACQRKPLVERLREAHEEIMGEGGAGSRRKPRR